MGMFECDADDTKHILNLGSAGLQAYDHHPVAPVLSRYLGEFEAIVCLLNAPMLVMLLSILPIELVRNPTAHEHAEGSSRWLGSILRASIAATVLAAA